MTARRLPQLLVLTSAVGMTSRSTGSRLQPTDVPAGALRLARVMRVSAAVRHWMAEARFVALLIMSVGPGCAATTAPVPVPGVSDVYFTNAESGPGYQLRPIGSTPYQALPEVRVFDRARDSKATIVIVFSTGDAHAIRAVLTPPRGGGPSRPVSWSTPLRTQFGRWTTTSAWWGLTPGMVPGRYTVDVTIDEKPAGSYSFELK